MNDVTPAPALPPWRQAAQRYKLLPPSLRTPASLVTRISDSLDSPGLNHLLSLPPLYLSVPEVVSRLQHIVMSFVPRSDAVPVLSLVCSLNVYSLYLLLISSIGSYRCHK